MKIVKTIFITLLFYMSGFGQLLQVGDEFVVNSHTDGSQGSPSVVDLVHGEYVICWSGIGPDNLTGIYAQIYNEEGIPNGEEIQIIAEPILYLTSKSIARLSNGGFVVSWGRDKLDGNDYDIYAQIFDETGTKIGNEFQVNTYTDGSQSNVKLIDLVNGGFVACWESEGQDGDREGIFAQAFDENGNKIRNEFQVNTYTNWRQIKPTVSRLDQGGFIICWTSIEQEGPGSEVYAQMYDDEGLKIGPDFRVNTFTTGVQINQSVTALPDNKLLICWDSQEQDGDKFGVFGQFFTQFGEPIGNEFQINTYSGNNQTNSRVSGFENGNFVVCWESNKNPTYDYDLYAQLFDKDGNKIGNEFMVNDFRYNSQTSSSVSTNRFGSCIITWHSYQQGAISYDVYAKYFTSELTSVKNSEIKLNKFILHQNYPNPFNPTTKIKFTIPVSEAFNASAINVKLTVYDVLGNEVTTLVDEQKSPGNYEVEFDASGSRRISSGIYFYKFSAGSFTATNKMLLMK